MHFGHMRRYCYKFYRFNLTDKSDRCPLKYIIVVIILLVSTSCSDNQTAVGVSQKTYDHFKVIRNENDFKLMLQTSNDKLSVIELFAEWCDPCRILEPILLSIAKEHSDRAVFYKLDVDLNREMAFNLGMKGIPYVVFIRNEAIVGKIQGLRPRIDYIKMIKSL